MALEIPEVGGQVPWGAMFIGHSCVCRRVGGAYGTAGRLNIGLKLEIYFICQLKKHLLHFYVLKFNIVTVS